MQNLEQRNLTKPIIVIFITNNHLNNWYYSQGKTFEVRPGVNFVRVRFSPNKKIQQF